MITFTNTIHIERPVPQVYAYLSDLEHTPEWNWAISETTKTTQGPIEVGTRYRQTRTVPVPSTESIEITFLEPNRLIEIEGTLAQFHSRLGYRLEDEDGGTRLSNTVNLEPQGAQRLLAPVIGGRIKRAVAENLGVLKARLETSAETMR